MMPLTFPVTKRNSFFSPLVIYTLLAAFIFSLGFFVHFGQEARASKSWKYVMSDGDDLAYWTLVKGRMMTPRCDGNPYYYEEQGTRHIIPYTSMETLGLLCKYTGIPLSWFFPAWYILMPLFVWFVIVVCCWKLWNYPLGVSAAGAMVLLLATLFYPWAGVHNLLFRFTRPLDGFAPLFIWISLIFRGNPANKKHCIVIIFVSALALWLHPFYAVFGLWITVLEYLLSLSRREGFLKARLHLYAMGSCLVSGLLFAGYAYFGKNTNLLLVRIHISGGSPVFSFLMTLLMFASVVSGVLFFRIRLKKEITPLDQLVMEWIFFGAFVFSFLNPSGSVSEHLLYFVPVMIFSLAGWIHEKILALKETPYYSRVDKAVLVVFAALFVFSLIVRRNFLWEEGHFYFIYIPQYFLLLFFSFWVVMRFRFFRQSVMRKEFVYGIILLLAIAGYWRGSFDSLNRDFPFDGGYQWLKQHAQKDDVVLTATLRYEDRDYLPLETGLKSYYSYHGMMWDDGSPNASRHAYRNRFRLGLFLNSLDKMPSYEGWSLDQKIHALKLDYILIPKPSPFFNNITAQLQGRLQVVFQDSRCLIWKVS